MISNLLIAALVAGSVPAHSAAPADGEVRAFFDRPEHSLSRAFAAQLAAADTAALRRCLDLLASTPLATASAALKDSCAAELSAEDLAPAAEEARALLASGVPPSLPPAGPISEKVEVMKFGLAELGAISGGALFDGSTSRGAAASANAAPAHKENKNYVTWGYNIAHYAPTDISFQQPSLGNDFTLEGVRMRDGRIQGVRDVRDHSISVPQYSVRLGRFIKKNTAIELNFDHAKAIVVSEQSVRLTGTMNGRPVDKLTPVSGVVQEYKLNNGANFALINVVQRLPFVGEPGRTGSIALLVKAGVGFMLPHTENTVLGQPNEKGFQYGGLGAGIEGAIRVHIVKSVFIEAAQKEFYGRYRDLNIHKGKAAQDLQAYVTIISLGTSF